MSAIPLVTVEEHHEAFFLWNRAARRGELPKGDMTLLHVDEHSDMSLPRLGRPLASIGDERDLLAFTYEELDIGNFIWPAVYQGLFNRVLWLRHRHQGAGGWREMVICGKNAGPTQFVTGAPAKLEATRWGAAPDRRRMEFAPIEPGDDVQTDQTVVLDVDLDYFCSNEYPDLRGRRLEVTRAAFEEFRRDPYHFLRIAPGSKVSAAEEGGRFYLLFNQAPEAPPAPDRAEVDARLDAFAAFLARQPALSPALVVVCRSVHSGYSPPAHVGVVEERLHGILAARYALRPTRITDLAVPAA